jgi:LysM repeat protein
MRFSRFWGWLLLAVLTLGVFPLPQAVQADDIPQAPVRQASAAELVVAMNTLRVAHGLPALIEDPIVNAVAQATAEIMAANNMSWHIGDVRGRLAAAGYGGGATVWATENFAVSSGGMGIDEIMAAWADPDHMRPAVTPAYCHVGAGIARASNGRIYYVLQAAYVAGQECGSISSAPPEGGVPGVVPGVPQIIIPVKIATPDAEGRVFHEVQAGQSFWAIAIAYQITIRDLEIWNNLSRDIPLKPGQRLFIPNENTEGYATPTPFGMFVPATPDADGKIVHEVQPYQALITIADAYKVPVDRILVLNGWQADWPLQVGQKLLIDPGHVTPSPTLTNIQKLTPEADGNYYHIVQSGETLSWIAGFYEIPLADLMSWNGLNNTSVIRPDQKLLLMVTPPPTATFTPGPATITPSPSPSATPSPTATPPPPVDPAAQSQSGFGLGLFFVGAILGIGGWIWWKFTHKEPPVESTSGQE